MGTAENRGRQRSPTSQSQTVFALTVLRLLLLGSILVLSVPVGIATDGWAQVTSPGSTGELRLGKVTAIGKKTIQIENKDYPLDPSVTIKDGVGAPQTLKDIRVGDPVRFHLKRGRIDQLILIMSPG